MEGPALIVEPETTTAVPPGFIARLDPGGPPRLTDLRAEAA